MTLENELCYYIMQGSVCTKFMKQKGESGNTYANVKEVLTRYFEPKTNIQIEIYNFCNCKQKEGQSLDEFVTELRQLSKNCGFTDLDKEILSQVIQHCSSSRFRRRALREPDKSLTEPIIVIGAKEKDPKRVAAGKRLCAISKQ